MHSNLPRPVGGKQQAERSMVEQLKQASASLCSATDGSPLAQAVRRHFPGATVFPIHWVPEQAEDIHWVLVSSTEIAQITIGRESAREGVAVEMIALQTFCERRLLKSVRRRLEAALELLGTANQADALRQASNANKS